MAGKLQDRTAVITGGNSGIGLATAREFKANGAHVVIFGRSRQTLDEAAASLGDGSLAVQGDVRKLGDMDRLFEQTAKIFGKIDILVANAGTAKFAPVEILPESLFDELCDIDFKGAFFTVQIAVSSRRGLGHSGERLRCRQAGAVWHFDIHSGKSGRTLLRPLVISRIAAVAHPRQCAQPRHDGNADHHPRGRPARNDAGADRGHHPIDPATPARHARGNGQGCVVPCIRRFQFLPRHGTDAGRRHDAASKTSIDIRRRRSWQSLGTRYPLTHHRTKSSRPLDAGWPRSWWTADAKAEEKVGGKADFGFDKRAIVFRMKIEKLERGKSVVWSCHGDQPEWNGTTLTWDLEMFAICNSSWGELMYRLKNYVEGRNPGPHWTE